MITEMRNWLRPRANWLTAALLSIAFLVSVILSIQWLVSERGRGVAPEVSMTLFIIASVAGLLASLTITTVVISSLNMGDRNQALGLPRGSVRALIALSLIIIFAMMSIYLFRQLDVFYLEDKLYEPSTEQIRFAQQLLTTLSTLVVAVSSFYFGARSVEVARRAVETPNLRVISPTSPAKLTKDKGKELPIKVEATPENEPINWDIKKDDNGSLVQVKPYEFIYTRGPSPGDIVTLTFKLRNYPDVTAELKVEKLEDVE